MEFQRNLSEMLAGKEIPVINFEWFKTNQSSASDSDSDNSGDSKNSEIEENKSDSSNSVIVVADNQENNESEQILINTENNQEIELANFEEEMKFFGRVNSNIPRFDGDPLKLEAFIETIELVNKRTPANFKAQFFDIVNAKIEGKAKEIIPSDLKTIEEIVVSLREKIKPLNSRVVKGRIAALKVKDNNYTEFMKDAELLAEEFRRALIVENLPREKANEMATESMVDLCSATTKSPFVRNILQAKEFADPQEVLSQLIVSQQKEQTNNQILAFRSQNNRGNFRRNTFPRNGIRRFNRPYNRRRFFNRNNSNNNNNNSNRNNGNNNRNNRGRFARRNNNNNGRQRDGANIRTVSLNGSGSQSQEPLRATDSDNSDS